MFQTEFIKTYVEVTANVHSVMLFCLKRMNFCFCFIHPFIMTLMSFTFGIQREMNGLYNVHLKSLNIQGIKFSIWSQNWCILYFS